MKISLQNQKYELTCTLSRIPQEGNMYQAFNYNGIIKILSLFNRLGWSSL